MKNYNDHLIHLKAPIKEALKRINQLETTLTLFVINDSYQLIGTLTDGDIRRGFLSGNTLEMNVDKFMTVNFKFLEGAIDVSKIHQFKKDDFQLIPLIDKKKKIKKIFDLNKFKSILPIDVVIMAGGKGQRLKPLTDTLPKPLIKIGEKSIIEHNIDQLILYGIENFHISVNYMKDKIIDHLKDGSRKGISIKYIEESTPLGTAGALSLVNDFKNDVLLINSDLFTNIDYEDLFLAFKKKNADIAVASVPYTVNIPYAIFEEDNNTVKNFQEKPSNTYYANSGIYLIKKELIKQIPKNTFFNATDLMQLAIDKRKKIIHNPLIGYWIDIGNHNELNKAREIIKHITNE